MEQSPPGREAQQIFDETAALYRRHAEEQKRQAARVAFFRGRETYHSTPFPDYKADKAIADLRETLIRQLTEEAEQRFSADPAARLDIPGHVVRELVDEHGSKDQGTIDFQAYWDALEARYSGQAGVEANYRQIADDLAQKFHIRPDQPIKRVAGKLSLSAYVYLDDLAEKYQGVKRLNYRSIDSIIQLLHNLAAFARWAGDDNAAILAQHEAQQRWYNRNGEKNDIRSRERIDLGDNLELITYQSRFEFRFAQPLADPLQLFLGKYAARLQPEAENA